VKQPVAHLAMSKETILTGMSGFQTVCTTDAVPEGQARAFRLGDTWIGIFHVGGQFFALEDRCPHAGASLARGVIEGDLVRCRIHHWGFCLRDGVYVDEDRPLLNARSLPLRVVGDEIQVKLVF
jgi:nitrite reductase (NADH) small subunit/3-phenylpropionate/trans-cinnamate dioxygenase ferredoxin subunit